MSFFNDSKKRNILITGGAGFVGYHLAKTLADENHNITIIDNFQRPNEDEMFLQLVSKDNVEHLKVDISSHDVYDNLEMNYYDVIYHFAALNGTANFYNHPEKVVKIGTLSTIYLLEWVAKHENRPKMH